VQLGVFLAGHIVAIVSFCVTEMITSCSPMIVASSDKEFLDDPSKSNYWKLF